MTRRICRHPEEYQLRLRGNIVTWCEYCGAWKYNGEKVWTRPDPTPE